MVFASVLVDVLNKFLEPYVERLDTAHLKVGIWNGYVQLDNIQLKEDLFKELHLPIKVKASHISNIEMKIPWKNLTKDVIVVTIDEIYIVAVLEPELDRPYKAEEDVARQQKKKDAEIKKLEEAAQKLKEEQEKKLKKGKEEEKPDTITEKLVSHLVKNLLVKIKDVHICYKDTVTNPSTIAMGVTLHNLELKGMDADSWKQCVSRKAATLIYKEPSRLERRRGITVAVVLAALILFQLITMTQ